MALVLAVEEYAHFGSSTVTADSGQKIGDAFKQRGFDVSVIKNPSDAVARASLRDFAQRAVGANTAIVVLSGHGVSYGGRTYFLPANAEITRDSDLLSRGLAIPSIAGIVGRAKFGGLFFFMTVANVPSTMQTVTARPNVSGSLEKNVVMVFSTSDKIPVSRVDRVSQQAAVEFAQELENASPLTAATLVKAAMAGGVGQAFGNVPDIDLSKAPPPPAPLAPPAPAAPPPVAAAKEPAPPSDAEKRAREAEEHARQAEARAKEAEERARVQEAEARTREAEARALEAEEKARAKTEQSRAAEATPPAAESQPPAPPAPAVSADVKSLTTVEELFGSEQRMRIQGELKKRSFYKGQIDSIFGDLTREAIRAYQKSLGNEETGYLTPQQLQSLIGS